MSKINLHPSQEQINRLEFRTNQAYSALLVAKKTQDHSDASYATGLFGDNSRGLFSTIVINAGYFYRWGNYGKRNKLYDRFILQQILGKEYCNLLEVMISAKNHPISIDEAGAEKIEYDIPTREKLFSAIKGNLVKYSDFSGMVRNMTHHNGKTEECVILRNLLDAIKLVRKTYPKVIIG